MTFFVALNTLRAKSIILIDVPSHKVVEEPIVIINAVSRGGGEKYVQEIKQHRYGVSFHPCLLVSTMPYFKVRIIQRLVDLFNKEVDEDTVAHKKTRSVKMKRFPQNFQRRLPIFHLNQHHGASFICL